MALRPSSDQTATYRVDELRAFIDTPGVEQRYLEHWRSFASSPLGITGFNWAAACFGLNWCFYRKLYGTGVVLLAVEFLFSASAGVVVLVTLGEPVLSQYEFAIGILGMVPARVALGALADSIYFRRACAVIAKANAVECDPERRREAIKDQGGISEVGLGAGIALSIASNFLVRFLL